MLDKAQKYKAKQARLQVRFLRGSNLDCNAEPLCWIVYLENMARLRVRL